MQLIWTATIMGLVLLAQPAHTQVRVPVMPPLVVPPPAMPAPPPLLSPPSLEVPVVPAPSTPPAVGGCPEAASAADCPGRSIQKNEGMGVLGPSIAR